MNTKAIKVLRIILVVAIPVMLIGKLVWLTHINFDYDLMGRQATTINSFIKPGSKIGLYSNDKYAPLIMQVQYVFAPHVIINTITADSLIYFQHGGGTVQIPAGYRMVAESKTGDTALGLIIKQK